MSLKSECHSKDIDSTLISDCLSIITDRTCTICLNDSVEYFALGCCDHPICSLCALRMRNKSKNKACAICKRNLNCMVICSSNCSKQRFFDFELDDLDDTFSNDNINIPALAAKGMLVDSENSLLFYQCRDHFKYLCHKKTIFCPIQHCRQQSFSSYQSLINHMQSKHAKGKDEQRNFLCTLCLENRPLFVDEQILMTKKELSQHMTGGSSSNTNHGQISAADQFTFGHPKCEFCKTHFFDQQSIYLHLQRQHFTCHLCDQSMMFRYYSDLGSLRDHHRTDHFLCSICDSSAEIRNSDIAYGYRTLEEYSVHMREIHGAREISPYIMTRNFGGNRKNVGTTANPRYYDLDVGTASPFPAAPSSNNLRSRVRSNVVSHHSFQPSTSQVPLIPPNMRIAGRVTGAGTFSSPDQSDQMMQAMSDASHAASAAKSRYSNAVRTKHGKVDESSFPILPSAGSSKAPTDPMNSTSMLHPLSLVGKPKLVAETEVKKASQQDDKRISRNLQLAEALGLNGTDKGLSSELIGAKSNSEAFKSALMEQMKGIRVTPSLLSMPMYIPELLVWARKSHGELEKIERKLTTLLADASAQSIALKPMKAADRVAVHCIARYYQLNSYEYDPEPKRYVSLAKTVQSAAPRVLLSQQCSFSPLTQAKLSLSSSNIYLILKDGLMSHWGRPTERKPSPYLLSFAFMSGGEIAVQARNLLRSYVDDLEIVSVTSAGPTAICFQFHSFPDAYQALQAFNKVAAELLLPVDIAAVDAPSLSQIFNYYRVVPDFIPPEQEETNEETIRLEYSTCGETRNHGESWIEKDSGVRQQEMSGVPRTDEEEFEDWGAGAASDAHIAAAAAAAGNTTIQENSCVISEKLTTEDDWEHVVESDDWEVFLAENRARAEQSYSGKPKPAVYKPPKREAVTLLPAHRQHAEDLASSTIPSGQTVHSKKEIYQERSREEQRNKYIDEDRELALSLAIAEGYREQDLDESFLWQDADLIDLTATVLPQSKGSSALTKAGASMTQVRKENPFGSLHDSDDD